jgi:transcriptional regulator NrdR family protein
MDCIFCGGRMRSLGIDKRGVNLSVCRWRKCNDCDNGFETIEFFLTVLEQPIPGPMMRVRVDHCPFCNSKTRVVATLPASPGIVCRDRQCPACGTIFQTQEEVCRTMVEYQCGVHQKLRAKIIYG